MRGKPSIVASVFVLSLTLTASTCFAQYDPDGLFQFSRYWQQEPSDETSFELNLNPDSQIDYEDLLRLIEGWRQDLATPTVTNTPTLTPTVTNTLTPTPTYTHTAHDTPEPGQNLVINGSFDEGDYLGLPSPWIYFCSRCMRYFGEENPIYCIPGVFPQSNGVDRVCWFPFIPISGIADGGVYQKVEGLIPGKFYRLSAWFQRNGGIGNPYYIEKGCALGYDLTGQTDDPLAMSVQYTLEPVQTPSMNDPGYTGTLQADFTALGESVSIWLRAFNWDSIDTFQAEFNDVSLTCQD